MEQMPPINPIVPSPPTIVQVVPEVAVRRDRIDRIVSPKMDREACVCVCLVVVVYAVLMK
jgi:hypothetical protein